jgi:hypothetical protein
MGHYWVARVAKSYAAKLAISDSVVKIKALDQPRSGSEKSSIAVQLPRLRCIDIAFMVLPS